MNTQIPLGQRALAIATLTITLGGCDLQPPTPALHTSPTLRSAPYSADLPSGLWAERGRLVAYDRVDTLSREEICDALFELPFADSYAAFGLEDFFDFYSAEDIEAAVRHRVAVYQVIYETVDPWGQPTVASGAVLLPRGGDVPSELPLWGLLRGTVFYDDDVPSHGQMPDWGIWRGLLPAAAGYVTAMPDYLGYGASRQLIHPYLVAEPTAQASIDMLRATRALATELGVPLREELFLSGHSQGGHATLATQRALEAEHGEEFELVASAPASGPYALSGIMSFLLGSDTLIAPQVTSLFTLTLAGTYELGQPLSYYFEAPYDELVLELFDKHNDNEAIIAGLPVGPSEQLFGAQFLADFRAEGALDFKAAMAVNDVHAGWTPQAPVRLFHGAEDSIVPPLQSQLAASGLAGEGAEVELELIEGAEHLQAIVPATLRTIAWFDSLLLAADTD